MSRHIDKVNYTKAGEKRPSHWHQLHHELRDELFKVRILTQRVHGLWIPIPSMGLVYPYIYHTWICHGPYDFLFVEKVWSNPPLFPKRNEMTTLLIWNRANPFESSQKSPTIYRVFFLHLSWFNSPTPGIFNLITSRSSNNKAALLPPNSVRTFQHRKNVVLPKNIPKICRKLTKPKQIHSKKNTNPPLQNVTYNLQPLNHPLK